MVSITLANVLSVTANAGYDFSAHIGTDVGRNAKGGDFLGSGKYLTHSWHDRITLTSTGTKALTVYAARFGEHSQDPFKLSRPNT